MGTMFEDVYCQNYLIKNDDRLQKLDPVQLLALQFKYLQYAISYFAKEDYPADGQTIPKVLRYTPFEMNLTEYLCDGIETSFPLFADKIAQSNFYITVLDNGVVKVLLETEFSYNQVTNSIEVVTAPVDGATISIKNYFGGTFLDVLDLIEITILSEGMNISYYEEAQSRQTLLNQVVYGANFKIHSQAEHLKRLIELTKAQRDYVTRLITDYSYRYNRNNYKGLRGGNFS